MHQLKIPLHLETYESKDITQKNHTNLLFIYRLTVTISVSEKVY